MNIEEFSEECKKINWDECPLNHEVICNLINNVVSDRMGGLIFELARHMLNKESLVGQAEKNPTLSRLVLFECEETGTKLRFHEFHPKTDARPHDHRWPFGSVIIGGRYIHELYARNDETSELEPIVSYSITSGGSYAISPSAFHRTDVV